MGQMFTLTAEALEDLLRRAWDAGWDDSGEGYNGEYLGEGQRAQVQAEQDTWIAETIMPVKERPSMPEDEPEIQVWRIDDWLRSIHETGLCRYCGTSTAVGTHGIFRVNEGGSPYEASFTVCETEMVVHNPRRLGVVTGIT